MKNSFFGISLLSFLVVSCQESLKTPIDVIPNLSFEDTIGKVGEPLSIKPSNSIKDSVIRSCSVSPALPSGFTSSTFRIVS